MYEGGKERSVFRVNIPNALSGTGLTQFGRALKELEIELICAHSPQAKGRVERANQTYRTGSPKNCVCMASPRLPQPMLVCRSSSSNTTLGLRWLHALQNQPIGHCTKKGEDLERVLALCERRTLSKNLTLSYNNVIYQIKTKRAIYTASAGPPRAGRPAEA